MNTPSPLVPQGTFQDKGKSHVRITVFAILAVHVVLLGVLLIAGCNKKSGPEGEGTDGGVPPVPPAPAQDGQWPTPAPSPTTNDAQIPPVPPPVPPPLNTATQGETHLTPPGTVVTPPGTVVTPPSVVPDVPVTPVTTDAGAQTEHTIAKGETLAVIGKKYGVGYKAIEAANPGLNPTRLKIGDKIKIPAAKPPGTATAPAPTSSTAAARTYVVRSGDNLLKIAKQHGVTAKQLRAANNLRTDQIRVGQKLKIPVQPSAPAEAVAPPPVAPPPVSLPVSPAPVGAPTGPQ